MASFSELSNDIQIPFTYTEFDPTQADRYGAAMPFTVLLAGQMFAGGTAEPLTLMRPTSQGQAEIMFGRGSQLAQMVGAYLNANLITAMYALGVPDYDGGIKAGGKITISGTVTTATPLCLYIGGMLVRLGVTVGQSAMSIMSALADLINSRGDLPVTAAVQGTDLELTARHSGECGNDIDLRFSYYEEALPGGLAIDITPMGGGSGNPEAGDIIAAMGDERFHVIAWPWADASGLAQLKAELDDRWGPLRQNDGHAVLVKTGAFAEVTTFAANQNNAHLTVIPSEGSPTLPWVDAAASSGVIAYYAADDPARPFQTLTIPGVLAPALKDRWPKFPEKQQGLNEGVSARGVTEAGEVMFLNLVTTYRFTNMGAETMAYKQLNTIFTLSYLRYDWNNYLKQKYPRHKLADDDSVLSRTVGQSVMTPKLGKAEAIARFNVWRSMGLVEAPGDFADKLIVQRNRQNLNRLDWYMSPDLINQFRVAGTLISFLL